MGNEPVVKSPLINRRVEYRQEDADFLEAYKTNITELYELVIEIVEKEPRLLLSPLFREMLVKKAHETKNRHEPIRMFLAVDNIGDPLKVRE
jgi:hypothetical protein